MLAEFEANARSGGIDDETLILRGVVAQQALRVGHLDTRNGILVGEEIEGRVLGEFVSAISGAEVDLLTVLDNDFGRI